MTAAAPRPPAPVDAPRGRASLRHLGRALRHRNYRLFFAGQGISLIGTWATRVAIGWLLYRLTGSALILGLVGFCGQIPTFVVAPFAGVLVDRWNRHRVLVVSQVLSMLQSAALAALALTDTITVPLVLALAAFQGLVNAFDTPARQAFVVDMIEHRDDLPNAIALNSTMVNVARLIGPSIAGVLIAAFGEGWCFAIDALSYVAVLGSLLAMRVRAPVQRARGGRMLAELGAGLRYATGSPPIRSVLLLLALVSLMGMPYTVLMPAFAREELAGDAHTLGLLMGAVGLGALLGALYLASRRSVIGLGGIIARSAGVFGVGLIAFSQVRWTWLALPVLALTGMAMIVQLAASNTILQTIVDEDKRGRVMSFYTMAFFGTAPLGSLIAGAIASQVGTPTTFLIGGTTCVVGALAFWRRLPELRRHVRPVYERLGILPERRDP